MIGNNINLQAIAEANWDTHSLDYYGNVYDLSNPPEKTYCQPAGRGIVPYTVGNALTTVWDFVFSTNTPKKQIPEEDQKFYIKEAKFKIESKLHRCYENGLCNKVMRKYNELIDKKNLEKNLKFDVIPAPKQIDVRESNEPIVLGTDIQSIVPQHQMVVHHIQPITPATHANLVTQNPIAPSTRITLVEQNPTEDENDDVFNLGAQDSVEEENLPLIQENIVENNVDGNHQNVEPIEENPVLENIVAAQPRRVRRPNELATFGNQPLDRLNKAPVKPENRNTRNSYLRTQPRVDYYQSHKGIRYI